MSNLTGLERLLKPKSIAVVGGDAATEVIKQCQSVSFDGEIWAVNPNRRVLNGVPCFAKVADLPCVPDASFIAAPPQASIEIVRELAALGAQGAVCYTAGFAESGEEGVKLQAQLREAAGDMTIIGPNCHGFLNYFDGVALWPDHHGGKRVERGVALVLQSGNIGINLSMQQRGLDLGYVISVGNKLSLGFEDYIDFLLEDPRVSAIGLHIEGIENIHEFSIAAIKALKAGVPIVAIKTGGSSRGAEITMSHTASLAGPDKLYTALFKRLGITRCNSLSEFLETLKFLSIVGVLPESTLGSLSCSGGDASMVADYAESLQIEIPLLSDKSVEDIRRVLGSKVQLNNPLDYHNYAWGNYEKINACFSAMLGNKFGCTILVLDYPISEDNQTENWEITERALIDAVAETRQRAVIVSTLVETLPASARRRLLAAGVAPMQGLQECLFAIRAAAMIGLAQANVEKILAVQKPNAICGSVTSLNEWQSKTALAEFGLAIPQGEVCSASETVALAEALEFPVVVKAVSEKISHKSQIGAVAVNLHNKESVQRACQSMSDKCDRFLVEKMIGPSIAEILIGVSRDPTFGLTLLLGAGGTLVELMDDTVSLLLPLQRQDIHAALLSLKVRQLLSTIDEGENAHVDAIIDAVEAVIAYCSANNASLAELDINPLIVTPNGVIVVDAFIRKNIDIS
jgi:acyl-CoA synthetase (NDP forming)